MNWAHRYYAESNISQKFLPTGCFSCWFGLRFKTLPFFFFFFQLCSITGMHEFFCILLCMDFKPFKKCHIFNAIKQDTILCEKSVIRRKKSNKRLKHALRSSRNNIRKRAVKKIRSTISSCRRYYYKITLVLLVKITVF